LLTWGKAHAVASCPGGPITQTFIGRKTAFFPAPPNQLPAANVGGDEVFRHFQAKGFSATDLGALIGAHSTARQFTTDKSRIGAPEDSTPGLWDILYYAQTLLRMAPFTIQADANLVKQRQVGPVMKRFSTDKMGWDMSFAYAFAKMQLLGRPNIFQLTDCTSALRNR
jgi:hypothetical protein